ncbi:peptidase MA family metallohydrolase [Maribacter litopenaei]|uniref:Peptidase MA family metallohydrolase n=1 Tax=Maribacter litopenaei TaxID=2976127 RepID=A0ABY5Y468_9FLAO|nr:peptidase MA family metallohydrolase [Maribacter litopenaei]UWX53783.1 peptidase MA family metallohydrolase [Maribacter litopenaei]
MGNSFRILFLSSFATVFPGCSESKEKEQMNQNDGWKRVGQTEKQIDNVIFTFPESGFAYKNRKRLVKDCFDAIKYDSELIDLKDFNDTIFIRFLPSREAMKPLTGNTPSGSAYPHLKTLYVVANDNTRPPIKHELMHLISMLEWGYPPPSSTWMNEGLGTFAENNCSGWTVAQMYRYLLENDQLISMNLLTTDFYKQPENFSYHQSAYIVEYLLENYSIEQFGLVWKDGFEKFEETYGFSFEQLKSDLEIDLIEKMPEVPEIYPQTFYKNCE